MFQILSDIHLEFYDSLPDIKNFIIPSAPYLVLAGDICFFEHKNFLPFFEKVSPLFKKIFYVLGNHDYFDTKILPNNSFKSIPFLVKESLKHLSNIYVLQNDYYEDENFIILGNTLWTSHRLNCKDPKIKISKNSEFIHYEKKVLPAPKIWEDENNNDFNWLKNFLKEHSKNKYIIVVTHYIPSYDLIPKKYRKLKNNFLFASNYDELLNYADAWIFGHGHTSLKKTINGCLCISNTFGYPDERQSEKNIKEINHSLKRIIKLRSML